tara:strand:+ start:15 stop:1988 length:1974 start_codon:yes stop_codon:yes gene_type:complete
MATPYRLKRSSVASKRPNLSDLEKGELALNFYDGHLFAERHTPVAGIGTTVANLTPWKETFGGAAINYENSVGIGSTNPIAKLDVKGQTELDDLNVSGIATFKGNIDADGNLDVDGQTDLDVLNVAELATFSGGIDINGTAEFERLVVTPGITTAVGGLHVGTGGTILSTGLGRVGVNTTQAGAGFEFEVYGNINIVGDDVEYYQNGARRTAGIGIQTGGTVVAGFGATIINFVGSGVSSIAYNAVAGIATVNINRGEFARNTTTYTATADQTTFTGGGLSYTPGYLDVYVNGVRLTGGDFTATNGTSVVLTQAAFVGDIIDVVSFTDEGFVDSKWSSTDGSPNNIFYTTGLVGVGTAAPRQTLDVEGNGNFVGVVTATKFYGELVGVINNEGDFSIDDYILHSGDTNTRFGFPVNDTFTLDTSGVESLRVDASGHIGIGTTNAFNSTVKIQAPSGTRALTLSGDTNGAYVAFETTGTAIADLGSQKALTGSGLADMFTVAGRAHKDIALMTYSSEGSPQERLRVRMTGDVTVPGSIGIGTTAPRGPLDVGEQFTVKTTTTTVAATTASTIDTLAIATYRSAKFQVQITQGTSYQSTDLMVIHDGTTPSIIEYGSIATGDYLGDFSAAIVGANLLLQVNMSFATSSTIKVVRYGISI